MSVIHVATADDRLADQLMELGAGHGFTCARHRGTAAVERLPAGGILVLDEALLGGNGAAAATTLLGRPGVVLVTDREVDAAVQTLHDHPRLAHVCTKADIGVPHSLGTTLQRLLGGTASAVADYLAKDAATFELTMTSTVQKQPIIDRLTGLTSAVADFSELPAIVATIATELITNACFNAPRDARGWPRYRDHARHKELMLDPGEEVTITYGHDAHLFVLAVSDRFGALTRATLMANFLRASHAGDRQIRMMTQGAGVGLFMVLSSAAQVDVHVAPGRRTEIVAVVALAKRYRDYARSGHALNLFFEEDGT